jgi:hypothetical protein
MRHALEAERLSQQHILRNLLFALGAALVLMSAVAATN